MPHWKEHQETTRTFVLDLAQEECLQGVLTYLAPGRYMDPSMKTDPHSRTYQHEHNSPRLHKFLAKREKEMNWANRQKKNLISYLSLLKKLME